MKHFKRKLSNDSILKIFREKATVNRNSYVITLVQIISAKFPSGDRIEQFLYAFHDEHSCHIGIYKRISYTQQHWERNLSSEEKFFNIFRFC